LGLSAQARNTNSRSSYSFYPRFHQGKTKRLLAIYLENDVAIVGPVPHVSPTLAYMGVAKDH